MKRIRGTTARLLALAALLAAGPVLAAAARPVHLELQKSSPTEGETVPSISEIRLWFSAAPMAMGAQTVQMKIMDAGGKTVSTGNAVKDPKDNKVYALALPRGLEPKAYRAAWQAMADDGDVVKGEIRFTVAATEGSQ